MEETPYTILELSQDVPVTLAMVKRQYKKLSLRYHPDRHPNATEKEKKYYNEQFSKISTAYQTLHKKLSSSKSSESCKDSNVYQMNAKELFRHFFPTYETGNAMFEKWYDTVYQKNNITVQDLFKPVQQLLETQADNLLDYYQQYKQFKQSKKFTYA